MEKPREIQIMETGPDMDAVLGHIEFLGRANAGITGQYQLEIRVLKEGGTPQGLIFDPSTDEGLNRVLAFVSRINGQGFNNYITVSPSQPTGSHVNDENIIQISFLFADADDRGAAEKVKAEAVYKPDAYVCTGTKPYERGHFYWQLEEPLQVDGFDQWKQLMQLIARRHGCDPRICNPSRIMRLGGTISYPSRAKRAKGYEIERTGFYDFGTS